MFSPRSMSTPTGDDNTLIRPPVADFVGDKGSNSRPATFIKPRSRIEPVRGELSKYVARLSSGRTLITPSTHSARHVRCTLLNSARTISSGIRSCFPSASGCHCGRKSPLRGRSASPSSRHGVACTPHRGRLRCAPSPVICVAVSWAVGSHGSGTRRPRMCTVADRRDHALLATIPVSATS